MTSSDAAMPHPRRPWVAALLSLVVSPGLGQLYNGRVVKAILFLIGVPFILCLLSWLAMRSPVPLLGIGGAFLVAFSGQLWSAFDAAREARDRRHVPRPWYGRWFALIAAWVFNGFLLAPACATFFRTFFVQAFRIPANAMAPALLAGDHVLVDKSSFGLRVPFLRSAVLGWRDPERGNLIAFNYPHDRQIAYIKRVIGLPGETIAIRGRTTYVNGEALAEPYARSRDPFEEERLDWGPQRVPAGHLFVLGDDRDNSRDSRYWGFLPLDDVLGAVVVVYFSTDDQEGVRWERIGGLPR